MTGGSHGQPQIRGAQPALRMPSSYIIKSSPRPFKPSLVCCRVNRRAPVRKLVFNEDRVFFLKSQGKAARVTSF